ncbi:MAG TPA: cellulose binding domain-containing protein, partial [Ktedonobacteraceae bacterium]
MLSFHRGSSSRPQQLRRVAKALGALVLLLMSLIVSLVVSHPTTSAASGLVLEYADANTTATSNQISPHFEIVNNTAASVPLSQLTIRYWYTEDGTQSQNFFCDYAAAGCANVTGSFTAMTSTTSTADTYLQVGFTSAAGSIAINGNSGDIQVRFAKSDWSNYNQANDYSWSATQTSYAPWNMVTLYLNGQLVAGTEPTGATAPTPTPTSIPTPTATSGTGGGSSGWTTSGTKILAPNGSQYIISGINWYGFETPDYAAHGLWSYDITAVLN